MPSGVGQMKKRPRQLSSSGVGEISVKKAKAAPEPLFTSAEVDDESEEEPTRLMEGGLEEVPFKVRFVPYPYTWREPMSPPSSTYITINVGHEESCGLSFSGSDCSLIASVDLADLNIAGGGLTRDARGRREVDVEGKRRSKFTRSRTSKVNFSLLPPTTDRTNNVGCGFPVGLLYLPRLPSPPQPPSTRSAVNPSAPKFSVAVNLERPNAEACRLGSKLNLRYAAHVTRSSPNETAETNPVTEEPVDEKVGVNGPVEPVLSEKKQGAMIHDFCFGIPFGGFVLAAGLIGFIFSRNVATLTTNVLFGGSLMALSMTSLKVWRAGKSCLPFILGEAVLAAVLCWKNFKTYSVTKQLFPSGVYGFLSAAMLCFFSYVVIAGGNPPPKKQKSAASYAS